MNAIIELLIYIAIFFAGILAIYLVYKFARWIWRYLHVITDKPLTFDQELREHMLPTGVYEIGGHQRVGKGSLGCAIMDTDSTYHGAERLALAQEFVDELNAQDDYNLVLPEHLYYSKNKMLLTPDYIETYHVDVLDVALPETKDDMHFAPYSMFHLEEADAVMNARTWATGAEKKANVIDGEKWSGHHHLVILLDGQVHQRFDAAVRSMVTDRFFVYRRRDYYSDDVPRKWWQFAHKDENHVIRTEWKFLWIKNQLYQQATEMGKFGEFFKPEEYIKKCKFVYEGNIYERYNPNSGQKYWLKDIEEFACAPHPEDNMTRAAVTDYCERNARNAENATAETEK